MGELKINFALDLVDLLELVEEDIYNLHQGEDEINSLFRAIHNVKSSTNLLGLDKISKLCQNVESIIEKIRNDELPTSTNIIDLLLRSVDCIKSMLSNIENLPKVSIDGLVFEMSSFGQHGRIAEKTEASIEGEPVNSENSNY